MLFINYLKSLHNYNTRLFRVVVVFIGLSIITFFLQITNTVYVEASPFVVWGMYSEKQFPKDNYQIPLITINNNQQLDYINNCSDLEKHILINTLLYYKKLQDNNDVDERRVFMESHLKNNYQKWEKQLNACTNSKEDYPSFYNWYKTYLCSTTKQKIDSVNFQLLNVQFSKEKKIIVIDTLNVIKF